MCLKEIIMSSYRFCKYFGFFSFFFFFYWIFFHEHSRITGLQGKESGISLTPHHHFHLLHRHLDINRAITEPGTFDFRVQVANHQATHPFQI